MRRTATLALLVTLLASSARAQQTKPDAPALPALPEAIRQGGAPHDVEDLRAMQAHVQALLVRVLPATVSLDGASGVIVEGGYVLTAAHVTRTAGRRLRITLLDGRHIDGVTLGANHRSDAGLIRITSKDDLPSRPMGHSSELRRGDWCLMLGEPSGTKPGRAATARLGRVLSVPEQGYLVTDCTMQSGDSGGPLFDMDGNVIGINSRINGDLAQNMHVPVDAFRNDWDQLVAGQVVEAPRGGGRGPRLGFGAKLDFSGDRPKVTEVVEASPAARAGIQAGDVILAIGGNEVDDRRSYMRTLFRRSAGDKVTLQLQRGDAMLDLEVELQREGR